MQEYESNIVVNTRPLSDEEILHLIATTEPATEWERLIPGCPQGGWPAEWWLLANFGAIVDNLTASAVAAAVWEDQVSTPDGVREHYANGKRRYGTKGNPVMQQATSAGLLTWRDERFSRGRVPLSVAAIMRYADAAVCERMGFNPNEDNILYTSTNIQSMW